MNEDKLDSLSFKLLIYVVLYLIICSQIKYSKAISTAFSLNLNFSIIKKHYDSSYYNNNIIYLSSGKPIFQNYFEKDFNLCFNSILIKKTVKHCTPVKMPGLNDRMEKVNRWVEKNDLHNNNPSFAPYSKYLMFSVGNYIINSSTFNNIEPYEYILSDDEIYNFSKSSASSDLIYLGSGYFFDKNFHGTYKSLEYRRDFCKVNDRMVKFEIYNPKNVSILGFLNDNIISRINFFEYQNLSKILDKKMNHTQYIYDAINIERKDLVLYEVILIIMLIYVSISYHNYVFLFSYLSLRIYISMIIKSYFYSKPTDINTFIFYTFMILTVMIYFFDKNFVYTKMIIANFLPIKFENDIRK